MIRIEFYGSLKRDFGGGFALHAASPADALNGLFSQISGLREKIRAGTFLVRLNGEIQSENNILEKFRLPENRATIHIVPRTAGAGRAGQIIAGAVLIGLAVFNPLGLAAGSAVLSGMMTGGIGLVLGGVAQMLAKPPKLDGNAQGQKASRNTAFSNLANSAAQGQPVPLAYGLVYAGSRVVSQGVSSRRTSQDDPILNNPTAENIALNIRKNFVSGVAATAPNGQPYNTDFGHDSVRAQNYVAVLAS